MTPMSQFFILVFGRPSYVASVRFNTNKSYPCGCCNQASDFPLPPIHDSPGPLKTSSNFTASTFRCSPVFVFACSFLLCSICFWAICYRILFHGTDELDRSDGVKPVGARRHADRTAGVGQVNVLI